MIVTPSGQDTRTIRWSEPAPLDLQEQSYCPVPGGRLWLTQRGKHGLLSVIASVDGPYLHVSIARSNRYPTWDEILAVRAWGFPEDMEVVMVLARKEEYVNLHPNCFHLWESACGKEGR